MRRAAAAARCRTSCGRPASAFCRRTARKSTDCCACRTTCSGSRRPGVRAARSRRFRQPSVAAFAPSASRRRRSATRRSSSALPCTTISAAALGVGARTSAAKSLKVQSISWPTADITGMAERTMARTTVSSLKLHKSSRLPPPRPTISTSSPPRRFSRSMAAAISSAAPAPCTRTGASTTCRFANRRSSTCRMSRMAAPVGEVTTPTCCGSAGSGRLRSAAKSPSAASRFFSASRRSISSPSPAGSIFRSKIW